MRGLLLLIPAALALAACGGNGGSEESGGTQTEGNVLQTIQLSEKEYSITPNSVTLAKAGTYEFNVTNDGGITHALEIEEEGGEEAKTSDIAPGESKTLRFTFSGDGSFEMYCPIDGHKDQGMKGTINVGGATSGGGGTTTDDDEKTTTDDNPGY